MSEIRPFPVSAGEEHAIQEVIAHGKRWGYGNLIHHLRNAWSQQLVDKYKMDRVSADRAAGHMCVWCDTDHRTGRKVPS